MRNAGKTVAYIKWPSYGDTTRPNEDALEYHSAAPAGKIAIRATKPCLTQRDLSLAYTPGVAVPCLAIEKDPSLAYKYTAKGNLVAVVTNGTAVLGLGNIGPLAGKPVMEGKGVLFKRFADRSARMDGGALSRIARQSAHDACGSRCWRRFNAPRR